jgi:hypothetical protein
LSGKRCINLIEREDWHPQRAAFDAATETNTARDAIHSAQAKWISGARIDQRRRAPASSRPHHPLAKHAGGDGEANGCSEAGCDEIMTADRQKNPT